MKLNSIQSKIGGALILILLIILGISFTVAALQSRNLLHIQQNQALKVIHSGTLEKLGASLKVSKLAQRGLWNEGKWIYLTNFSLG